MRRHICVSIHLKHIQAVYGVFMLSREEFDTQQAVLAHTREKLELLEKRFTELDEKLTK